MLFGFLSFGLGTPGRSEVRRDLRLDASTTTPQASAKIHEAEQKRAAHLLSDALGAVREAERLDPKCQFAVYLETMILEDQGDVLPAISAGMRGTEFWSGNVDATVLFNLDYSVGLMLAAVKRPEESNHWLSRALLDGQSPAIQGELATLYTTMANNLRALHQPASANLASQLVTAMDPRNLATPVLSESMTRSAGQEENDDVARVLFPEAAPPRVAARTVKPSIEVISSEELGTPPLKLLTDRQGRYVVLLFKGLTRYGVLIMGETPRLEWRELHKPIGPGYLSDDRLFIATADRGSQLLDIEPRTGFVRHTYVLGAPVPASLVVAPAFNVALFPLGGFIQSLALDSGRPAQQAIPCDDIATDNGEAHVYAISSHLVKGRRSNNTLADGGPSNVSETERTSQTLLLQMQLTRDRPVLAAARDNAGTKTSDIVVSPDGRWVALPGTGGWHPSGRKGGWVLPVYSTADFSHVQTTVEVGAGGAKGACFNPVTNEVAVVREGEVAIVHLSAGQVEAALPGAYTGACAWSGDGRYLVLTHAHGLTVARNALGAEEQARANTWWQQTAPADRAVAHDTAMPELLLYSPTDDAAVAQADIHDRLTGVRDAAIGKWEEWSDYKTDSDTLKAVQTLVGDAGPSAAGLHVSQLRELHATEPRYVPVTFFLAEALKESGQLADVEPLLIDTVRADRGQTELTTRALEDLADLWAAAGRKIAAAHALAVEWSVDRKQPGLSAKLGAALAAVGMTTEGAILRASTGTTAEPTVTPGGPGATPKPVDAGPPPSDTASDAATPDSAPEPRRSSSDVPGWTGQYIPAGCGCGSADEPEFALLLAAAGWVRRRARWREARSLSCADVAR